MIDLEVDLFLIFSSIYKKCIFSLGTNDSAGQINESIINERLFPDNMSKLNKDNDQKIFQNDSGLFKERVENSSLEVRSHYIFLTNY